MKRTPLKRLSELRRTGRIKPKRPPAGATSGIRPDQRITVLLREKGMCLRCGAWMANIPSDCHHRKLRSRGGTDDTANLVHICAPCHREVHTGDTLQATDDGWLVPSGLDPAGVPVLSYRGWVSLDDAGNAAPLNIRKEM